MSVSAMMAPSQCNKLPGSDLAEHFERIGFEQRLGRADASRVRANPSALHHARYREMLNDEGITRRCYQEMCRMLHEGRVPLECAEDATVLLLDDIRDMLAVDDVDWADGHGLRRTVKKKGLTTGR